MNAMNARLDQAAQQVRLLGHHPAYLSLYGSQNYGLALDEDNYRSDFDFKCVVLPSLRALAEGRKPVSRTVDTQDGQIDIKDIRVFSESVCKMNPAYLECLLTPNALALAGGEAIEKMKVLLPALFCERGADFARVCAKSFDEKERRLYHTSPAQAENIARYGYDLKQAHHMYRLLVTMRVFEETGEMRLAAPEEEKALLLDLKRGRFALTEIKQMVKAWRAELGEIEARCALAYGKAQDSTAKKIMQISAEAIDEHCRKEVLQDAGYLL